MAHVPEARNAWAPECFYDRARDLYRVLWSSSMQSDGSGEDWNHRIWATTTRDFVTYSLAKSFFDPGFSVIDATVAFHKGAYLMAFKDEREENQPGTGYKAIRICHSTDGVRFTDISGLVTPSLVEGPSLFQRGNGWVMAYDYFLEERYGASMSEDGWTWRPLAERTLFPHGARHGSVFPIDARLVDRLCRP